MEEVKEILHSGDASLKSFENTAAVDKIHLLPLKSQISSIKCAAVESYIELLFCNKLGDIDENKENCLADNEDQERGKMEESKKESENAKKDISEVEENLKELSETIQARFKGNQEKVSILENQLSIIKEKEEKYKKLLERKRLLDEQKQLYSAKTEESVSGGNLQEKVHQTEEATLQCSAAIDTLREHKLLLEEELRSQKVLSENIEMKLSSLKKKQDKSVKQSKEQERMSSLKTLITTLSGFKVVNAVDNCVTIEIQDIQQVPTEDRAVILLTIRFVEVDGEMVVEDVKTNSFTFFIKDIIEQVKSTSQLNVFLLEVQKRFHNEAKLLNEMSMLQERFAIDWNEETQTVRVMLGKSGQIVCTLKIYNGYPSSGHVSLEEIQGADKNLLFEDMTSELKSLTIWIEYLSIKYGAL